MSYFDDNEDYIIYGRRRHDEDPEPRDVACKHCGKTRLNWQHDGDRWMLMEGGYKVHKCDAKAVARNVADDFDVIEASKRTFEIKYKDPNTGEWKTVTESFDHSDEFPASMWAEDRAYALADKGPYKVRELT
jgi:hypothetical protein